MSRASVTTRLTGHDDLDVVAELFDQYRQFYKQVSDVEAARRFLTDRLEASQSVIILAEHAGKIAGFTQLYPSFSSVSISSIWILNDLYVAEADRRTGVGEALLEAAKTYARGTSAAYLILSTGEENSQAQALYESNGWAHESDYRNYIFQL